MLLELLMAYPLAVAWAIGFQLQSSAKAGRRPL